MEVDDDEILEVEAFLMGGDRMEGPPAPPDDLQVVEEDHPVNAYLNDPEPRVMPGNPALNPDVVREYQNELAEALERQRWNMIRRGDPNPWNMNARQGNPFDPQNPNPWQANPYRVANPWILHDPLNVLPLIQQNLANPQMLNPPNPPNPQNPQNPDNRNLWVNPIPFILQNPQFVNAPPHQQNVNPQLVPGVQNPQNPINANAWNRLDPEVFEQIRQDHEAGQQAFQNHLEDERRHHLFGLFHEPMLRQRERQQNLLRQRANRPRGVDPLLGVDRDFLLIDDPFRVDQHMVVVEQHRPLRKYPLGSGFPVVSEIVFDKRNSVPQLSVGAHGDLDWIVRWSAHHSSPGILAGQCIIAFNGMGNNAYKIYITHESTEPRMGSGACETDEMVIVDKNHYQIVFPYTMMAAVDNSTTGRYLVPDITLTLSVHNIEKIDSYSPKDHLWPNGYTWLTYKDFYSVRIDKQAALERNPHFDRILEEMESEIMSEKESLALYDVLCLIFQRSFYGTEEYHEVMLNGLKMGFTEGWDRLDLPDTALDFHSRTTMPVYQILTKEDPVEQVNRDDPQCGACDIFRLKLNPHILYRRSQMEPMIPIRGHKGQYTIYLEETNHGLLLLVGVTLQVLVRQQAKLKMSLFENGFATLRYTYYRIVDKEQKTIKAVVAVLNPVQQKMMIEGKLSLNIQLHVTNTDATFIHNYQTDLDVSTPYVMPGVINGWLHCDDGKKIGVCKEHIAHHSLWFEQIFFNTSFSDCGKDNVTVSADSEIVMDLLNVIYHRCHAVHLSKLSEVMELARYWLSPICTRYFDMAVLRTPLLSTVDKVKLAMCHDLEVCKYIFRHPEYHTTYSFGLPDSILDHLEDLRHPNELDGGENGRQEEMEPDEPDPMEADPNIPGPAPPAPAPDLAAPAP